MLAEEVLEFLADFEEKLLAEKVEVGERNERPSERKRTLGEQAPRLSTTFLDRCQVSMHLELTASSVRGAIDAP